MNSIDSSRETHENILNVSSAHYNFHTCSHISRSVVAWCWSSLQLSTFIGTSQCLLGICHWLVLSSWRSGFITKMSPSYSQKKHSPCNLWLENMPVWPVSALNQAKKPQMSPSPYWLGYFWAELTWVWVNASRMTYISLMFQLTAQKLQQIPLFVPRHAQSKSWAFSLASVLRKEVGNGDENFPSNSAGNNLSSQTSTRLWRTLQNFL